VNPLRLIPALVAGLLLAAAGQAAAQDQRTFLEITVNTVAKGDALVVLRGADVLVPTASLETAGVRGFDGRRETVDGDLFVSLASLAPAVTFTVNERDLRLELTVSPDLLERRVRDLQQGRPANLVYRRDTSGFFNYSVSAGSSRDYGVFSEAGLSIRGALLSSTLSASPGSVVRGLTSLTIDDRSRIRRWVVGDTFATGGTLGGDTLMAGVTVGREFAVEPYFVRYPTFSLSTPLTAPSTVEVHVNGRLVRQEQVQPGVLDVRNLPLTTGSNDTRIVIRDPFGGTREVATAFYSTASVLAPGLHDYQYSLGVTRTSVTQQSWEYGRPALLARHRVGLNSVITAGGRIEAAGDLASGGPTVNLRLPFGEVEAAVAASRAGADRGRAFSTSYVYASRSISAGSTLRLTDAHYATLSLGSRDQRPRTEASVFAGVPLPGGISLTLQHSHALLDDDSIRTRSEVLTSARIGRSAHLMATATRVNERGARHVEASVGLMLMFGSRTTATTSVTHGPQGVHTSVDLQRPLPIGTGFGYQVRTDDQAGGRPSGTLQYQGAHGRYEVRHESAGGRPHTSVNVSGAIVGIGGGLFATRPVRNSFALVQVPGVKDVRGFSSHREIGRTNGSGNILVPDLLPYYGNQLDIADADVPIDYVIPSVSATVAPPYRGGALVRFEVQKIQRSHGKVLLVIDGAERVPTYGELSVGSGAARVASPIGASGQFYFENLAPGSHAATVESREGTCTFTLRVVAAETDDANLGTVTCEVAGGKR
jgi:outer membrane usher protein